MNGQSLEALIVEQIKRTERLQHEILDSFRMRTVQCRGMVWGVQGIRVLSTNDNMLLGNCNMCGNDSVYQRKE